MSAPLILGLVGRKRTGKDTIADRMIREHGFTRLAFADPLKEAALGLDPVIASARGWDYEISDDYRLSEVVTDLGWEEAKKYDEVRRTLQRLGVAMREAIGPDVWVDALAWEMNRQIALGHDRFVITDVRFPNEGRFILRMGGRLVAVTRAGLDDSDSHVSETNVDRMISNSVQFALHNHGSIENLHANVDDLIDTLTREEYAA